MYMYPTPECEKSFKFPILFISITKNRHVNCFFNIYLEFADGSIVQRFFKWHRF